MVVSQPSSTFREVFAERGRFASPPRHLRMDAYMVRKIQTS